MMNKTLAIKDYCRRFHRKEENIAISFSLKIHLIGARKNKNEISYWILYFLYFNMKQQNIST